jgi:guanylate kinase
VAEGIRWKTKAGKNSYAPFRKFKTVAECLLDPPVDQSWQEKPLNKSQMVAWIPAAARGKAKSEAEAAETKARKGADAGARPLLLVLSGPSGAGKTVLRDELLRTMPEIQKSTTVTTRAPRKGEVNGVDYVFVSPDKFAEMAAKGEFLEWAEVHGNKYGSSKADVSTRLAKGEDVILIVDVQGAASIRGFFGGLKHEVREKFCYADVFVSPPSIDELRKRLVERGKDDEATIDQRIKNAKAEMARAGDYKYVVLNDTMDRAWDRIRSIVVAERCMNPEMPF